MRRELIVGALLLSASIVVANAQATRNPTGSETGPTMERSSRGAPDVQGQSTAPIAIAPEQRAKIREYVVQQSVRPYRERISVGATLPAEVELHTVPADWGPSASRYRYVYADDRVHFVDPSSRRVIYGLD